MPLHAPHLCRTFHCRNVIRKVRVFVPPLTIVLLTVVWSVVFNTQHGPRANDNASDVSQTIFIAEGIVIGWSFLIHSADVSYIIPRLPKSAPLYTVHDIQRRL